MKEDSTKERISIIAKLWRAGLFRNIVTLSNLLRIRRCCRYPGYIFHLNIFLYDSHGNLRYDIS